MVAETLTVADLATRLNEVLDRASKGEQFAIEEDGVVFAVIRPPAPSNASPEVSSSPRTTYDPNPTTDSPTH